MNSYFIFLFECEKWSLMIKSFEAGQKCEWNDFKFSTENETKRIRFSCGETLIAN